MSEFVQQSIEKVDSGDTVICLEDNGQKVVVKKIEHDRFIVFDFEDTDFVIGYLPYKDLKGLFERLSPVND